jgi:hypothetical protein
VSPDIEEGLLDGVLGHLPVTQDAVGDLEQPRLIGDRQSFECTLVAELRTSHKVVVHPDIPRKGHVVGPLYGMSTVQARHSPISPESGELAHEATPRGRSLRVPS